MAKNQFLNWGKSLKLPKMQFHENFFEYFPWNLSKNSWNCIFGSFKLFSSSKIRRQHRFEYFQGNARLASFPSSIWWFCSVFGKKTRFICYITLICCELNFFVSAGWAETAKKICNYLGGNLPHTKNDTGSY